MQNLESKLIGLGGQLWEKGSKRRVYFNADELAALFGIVAHRYGAGAISNATMDGEKISNGRARRLIGDSIYVDLATGDVGGYADREAIDLFNEKIAAAEDIVSTESEKYAVYQSEGILAVGSSIDEAVRLAGETMDNVAPFNPGIGSGNYDAGVIVDLTHTTSLGGDSEVCSGSSARIRYITDRLAAEVESTGGNIAFQIRDDGVLDVWED